MNNKEERYAQWLNGEISDAELEAMDGSDTLQELKQVIEEVDQWSLPTYDTNSGYQKMQAKLNATPPKRQGINWLKVMGIAGVIGCLLFGLFYFYVNKPTELKADPGQHLNYAFQDGSEVWLNDGSSVEYNSSDWTTERTIALQGEALFEVSKGSPFTVNTHNGSITVLGTQFNVRAWGDNLYVECYEGKVQVTSGNQTTILTANQAVNVIGNEMKNNQAINNSAPTWQNGMSRFYDDTLTEVCNELERQYQITIDLQAKDRSFSGNFKHDDLDSALRSICTPLDLKYVISQDRKSVVIE